MKTEEELKQVIRNKLVKSTDEIIDELIERNFNLSKEIKYLKSELKNKEKEVEKNKKKDEQIEGLKLELEKKNKKCPICKKRFSEEKDYKKHIYSIKKKIVEIEDLKQLANYLEEKIKKKDNYINYLESLRR